MNKKYKALLNLIERCEQRLRSNPAAAIPEKAFLALVEAKVKIEIQQKKSGARIDLRSI